ncbi:MAG: transcriptional regulator [Tepidisphaeraceae bacterium]
MAFDPLVTNAGRLRILTALAVEPTQPFVRLRRVTGLTDGNLTTHARRLQSAGFVAIEKTITGGKPLTTLHLTRNGRAALASHARELMDAIEPHAAPAAAQAAADEAIAASASPIADEWID